MTADMLNDPAAETWRAIPGFSHYEASSLGRVRSTERLLEMRTRHGRVTMRRHAAKVLSPYRHRNGYLTLNLRADGESEFRHYCVNRLVFAAFVREPLPHEEVDHRNRKRDDNRVTNLRALSVAENRALRMCRRGDRHPQAKLDADSVRAIRECAQRETHRQVALRYGVSRSLVGQIAAGKVWGHVA